MEDEIRSTEISHGDPERFRQMREKLEASIELTAAKRVSYSITRFVGSDGRPSVVTFFAACITETDAQDLCAKITDLVRQYFPTITKSQPGPVN
jgi:hypothetical protein